MDLFSAIAEVRLSRWVRRAQGGDREAFCSLYRALHPLVYRYVARRVPRREDAEDVVAQLFTRLVEGLGRIDPRRGSVRAYMLSAARRAVVDHARGRLQREHIEIDPGIPALAPDAEAKLVADERLGAVRDALAAMSADKRELLLLRFDSGLRFAEIAEVVGSNEVAVRQRVSRALRELRGLVARSPGWTEEVQE